MTADTLASNKEITAHTLASNKEIMAHTLASNNVITAHTQGHIQFQNGLQVLLLFYSLNDMIPHNRIASRYVLTNQQRLVCKLCHIKKALRRMDPTKKMCTWIALPLVQHLHNTSGCSMHHDFHWIKCFGRFCWGLRLPIFPVFSDLKRVSVDKGLKLCVDKAWDSSPFSLSLSFTLYFSFSFSLHLLGDLTFNSLPSS